MLILSKAEFLLHVFCVLQVPSPKSFQPNGASEEALRCEIEELKQKDLALDEEIAQLLSEGYSLEELDKHISLLHEYNEIKDAGQMLLGKLAVIRGVTTKQLYPEYDLELIVVQLCFHFELTVPNCLLDALQVPLSSRESIVHCENAVAYSPHFRAVRSSGCSSAMAVHPPFFPEWKPITQRTAGHAAAPRPDPPKTPEAFTSSR
ncbi:hypothetical protein IHE44_0007141 [Lamprotornis superbus]|uniref:DNA repair protein SWI5 homolog n=1 Tax=Lamprotornis superbus TaxID=245042 RepID=A0A835NRY4_9PASS|nr:hypothetical protein IHE44_0007141 [Lamprotornis superbus]